MNTNLGKTAAAAEWIQQQVAEGKVVECVPAHTSTQTKEAERIYAAAISLHRVAFNKSKLADREAQAAEKTLHLACWVLAQAETGLQDAYVKSGLNICYCDGPVCEQSVTCTAETRQARARAQARAANPDYLY